MFPDYCAPPDIIAFQELHFDLVAYEHFTVALKSYKCFSSLFPGCAAWGQHPARGAFLGIKKCLGIEVLQTISHDGYFILVKCQYQKQVFVLGSIYLPTSFDTYSEIVDKLNESLVSLKCENIVLMGDFNCSFSAIDNSIQLNTDHIIKARLLEKLKR